MQKNSNSKQQNERVIHSTTVNGRTFYDVKNIKKFNKRCTRTKCKYYDDCYCNGVFSFWDCRKNAEKIAKLYAFITSVIILLFTVVVFKFFNLSILQSIALIIASAVAFDIFCTILEWLVSKTRMYLLYHKLNHMEKKKAALAKKEKILEQKNGRIKNLYHDDIESAETAINALKKLAIKLKFAGNEKILESISELNNIIVALKKDANNYLKVAYIFEVRLPNFYNLLTTYEALLKLEKEAEAHQAILKGFKRATDKFLQEVKAKSSELVWNISLDEKTDKTKK